MVARAKGEKNHWVGAFSLLNDQDVGRRDQVVTWSKDSVRVLVSIVGRRLEATVVLESLFSTRVVSSTNVEGVYVTGRIHPGTA